VNHGYVEPVRVGRELECHFLSSSRFGATNP
jgi:hypothetical protein